MYAHCSTGSIYLVQQYRERLKKQCNLATHTIYRRGASTSSRHVTPKTFGLRVNGTEAPSYLYKRGLDLLLFFDWLTHLPSSIPKLLIGQWEDDVNAIGSHWPSNTCALFL